MNPTRIETITRLFADRKSSRRQPLAAGTRADPAFPAVAQGASPDASPIAPDAEHGPEMLFVQSFQSGSIVPSERNEGRYTITLDHGLGETIYFSDRPNRIVGTTPTAAFLAGLGFSAENPPNAAILTQNPDGDATLAVVELFAPVYDDATAALTYDVQVLDHWVEEADLGFSETPIDLDALGATFGTTHLFIDDCADEDLTCVNYVSGEIVGVIPNDDFDGWCYSWWPAARCLPCQPWNPEFLYAGFAMDSICRRRFCDVWGPCRAEYFH